MSNPNQDGWDWPYILYVGRVWLGYTEKEIWALTPRQFSAQLAVHEDITKRMYGERPAGKKTSVASTGYIDQIPGW